MPVRQGGSGLGGQFGGAVIWIERRATPVPSLPVPARSDIQGLDDLYGAWINHANTRVFQLDRQRFAVSKLPNASSAYDSDAYSPLPLTGDFVLKVDFGLSSAGDGVYGLSTDPLSASDDTNMTHRLRAQSGNQLAWWKSGSLAGGFITATAPYWIYRVAGTIYFASGPTAGTLHDSIADSTTYYADSSYFFDQLEYEAGGGHVVSIYSGTLLRAYTLAADVGSYALTGTATGVSRTRALVATLGSYAITGTATGLNLGHNLVAAVGSYSLTGTATNLTRTRKLVAAIGSYTATGTATNFRIARRLVEAVGSYTITGTATALRTARRLTAAVGSYSLTGTATALKTTRRLTAAVGSYTISGTATGLKSGRQLAATPGAYAYNGTAVTLTYTPVSPGNVIHATPGSYSITGNTVQLIRGRRLNIAPGTYLLQGYEAQLIHDAIWAAADPVSGTWTGPDPVAATWTPETPTAPTWINQSQSESNWEIQDGNL